MFTFSFMKAAQEFLYTVGPNEIAPRLIDSEPSAEFSNISPGGDWLLSGSDAGTVVARPVKGGSVIPICSSCGAGWGSGGQCMHHST